MHNQQQLPPKYYIKCSITHATYEQLFHKKGHQVCISDGNGTSEQDFFTGGFSFNQCQTYLFSISPTLFQAMVAGSHLLGPVNK